MTKFLFIFTLFFSLGSLAAPGDVCTGAALGEGIAQSLVMVTSDLTAADETALQKAIQAHIVIANFNLLRIDVAKDRDTVRVVLKYESKDVSDGATYKFIIKTNIDCESGESKYSLKESGEIKMDFERLESSGGGMQTICTMFPDFC